MSPSRSRLRSAIGGGAIGASLMVATAGHFTEVRYETERLADPAGIYERVGRSLKPLEQITIASTEAGRLAYFSDQVFLDLIGLNNHFVAFNKAGPRYSDLFLEYIRGPFGFPDVYMRPGSLGTSHGAEAYAYLETPHRCGRSIRLCIRVELDDLR